MMMATKKPRRPKKKKQNKKVIELNFHTSKKNFANGIIINQMKDTLYNEASLEELENEFKQYDIEISQEKILQEYKTHYNIEKLINDYLDKFSSQFEKIEDLNILFDEDAILYYLNKLIKSSFQLNEIPDADFINEAFEEYLSMKDGQKNNETIQNYFLTLLKTINQLDQYTLMRNLQNIFSGTLFDIEWALSDGIVINFQNTSPNYEITKKVTDEIWTMLEKYKMENPEYLFGDALEILARHGLEKAESKFKEGLKSYPKNQVRMYLGVINGLEIYYDKSNDNQTLLNLYQEALNIPPVSDDDKDLQDILRENYQLHFTN